MGKNIRKSPFHQPNVNTASAAGRQQPQPQIYNISKSDFRDVVQQLTGSPLRSQEPLSRPPQNLPKPPSMRLQKIRPPPLTPLDRTHIPSSRPVPVPAPAPAPAPAPGSSITRPPLFAQSSPTMESPVSAYMRYLQSSILDAGPRQTPPYHQPQIPQPGVQFRAQPPPSAQLPTPPVPALLSPQMNGPAALPSPASQFLLPSPGFLNMLSPRSPMPLLSPGYQFPPPLTPLFPFSPIGQPGILGSVPQPPLSPGAFFPLSPSGLFPSPCPRWRDQ